MNEPKHHSSVDQATSVDGSVRKPKHVLAVIIPSYNAEKWIVQTTGSVLEQNCDNTEIIVVDDGSSDGTVEKLEAFGRKIRIERQSNQGACAARNRGLKISSSKYVMFLDADDLIEGDFLKCAVLTMNEEAADIGLGKMVHLYPTGERNVFDHFNHSLDPPDLFENWLLGESVGPASIIWRSDFVREIGGWDNRLAKFQDGEIILRAFMHMPKVAKLTAGAGVYNLHSEPSIAKRSDREAVLSEFNSIERLRQRAMGTEFERRTVGFRERYYFVAAAAFEVGAYDLGERSLQIAQSFGFDYHKGTLAHVIASNALGLRRKVILAKMVRKLLGHIRFL